MRRPATALRLAGLVPAALLAALAVAPAARGATFCVAAPGCAGTAVAGVQEAFDAAEAATGFDDVVIGPGTFTAPTADGFVYDAAANVRITGSGLATVLRAPPAALRTVDVRQTSAASQIRDLVIEIHPDAPLSAVGLRTEASAWDIRVQGGTPAASRRGIVLLDGADLHDSVVLLGLDQTPSTVGVVVDGADAVVNDTVVLAGTGFEVNAAGAQLRRVATQASVTGVRLTQPGTVSNCQVHMIGTGSTSMRGVLALNTQGVSVRHCTLVLAEPVSGSAALAVRGEGATALLEATGVLALRFANALSRVAAGGGAASMTVEHSRLDPAETEQFGIGLLGIGENVVAADGPSFIGEFTSDLRLRHDANAVDAGDPAGVAVGELDALRDLRYVDGTGSGTARIDVGAVEYQRRAPVPVLAGPATGAPGELLTFSGSATDPDGETPALALRVDGGAPQPGGSLARAFDQPGEHTVELVATDPAGLTATAVRTVQVVAPGATTPPPAPAPAAPAVPARPRLVGLRVVRGRARMSVDMPARIDVVVQRERRGWRSRGRCLARSPASRPRARRCVRLVLAKRLGVVASRPGTVSVALGRLAPARYRLLATATSQAGARSATARAKTTVRRPRARRR